MHGTASPPACLLDAGDLPGVARYLERQQWLYAGEQLLSAERAGEGNMNLVLRLTTDQRSLVLKQSRPWVEKYPQVSAPWERASTEARFYGYAQEHAQLRAGMPLLLGHDAEAQTLLLEDLGPASDALGVYAGEGLAASTVRFVGSWLGALHRQRLPLDPPPLPNRAMRALNHEHMYVFPFQEAPGLDLDAITPGLEAVRQSVLEGGQLSAALTALGEVYLADGPVLQHGDCYPGSWIAVGERWYIIDPEFAFGGVAEFDVGIVLAHLDLSLQPPEAREALCAAYAPDRGFDTALCEAFAAAEVLRRLLGLAQLPLQADLCRKRAWIEAAAAALHTWYRP